MRKSIENKFKNSYYSKKENSLYNVYKNIETA